MTQTWPTKDAALDALGIEYDNVLPSHIVYVIDRKAWAHRDDAVECPHCEESFADFDEFDADYDCCTQCAEDQARDNGPGMPIVL